MQQRCCQTTRLLRAVSPRQNHPAAAFKNDSSASKSATGKRRVSLRPDIYSQRILRQLGEVCKELKSQSRQLEDQSRQLEDQSTQLEDQSTQLEDQSTQLEELPKIRKVLTNHTGQLTALNKTAGQLVEEQVRGAVSTRRAPAYSMPMTTRSLRDLASMVCDSVELDADTIARAASQQLVQQDVPTKLLLALQMASDGSAGEFLSFPDVCSRGANHALLLLGMNVCV
jgi:hypothetical protein